jgi:CDP-4-dehydro-6-deoxyglucose reductase
MRRPDELYWELGDWANLKCSGHAPTYVPVLSRAEATWSGARGHVQQVAIERHRDWQRTTVYACGSEMMIEGARQVTTVAGLDARRFYADAFVCSTPN